MIIEETDPRRIRDLLSASWDQSHMIRRLIVEAIPGFRANKMRRLIESNRWPNAVYPYLIASTESQKDLRAQAIWQRYLPKISGKFLDYGCIDQRILDKAKEFGIRSALGFGEFRKEGKGFLIVDDWSEIENNAPYDHVLLYDILDHVIEEPTDVLKKIHDVLSLEGRVYVRTHPWCSRSGTHAYRKFNKAFVHLFFTEDELEDFHANGIVTRKIMHPIVTYGEWFYHSGFYKISEKVIRKPVEDIFQQEEILIQAIREHWKESCEDEIASGERMPLFQMEQLYHDYVLQKRTR